MARASAAGRARPQGRLPGEADLDVLEADPGRTATPFHWLSPWWATS